MLGFDFGLVDQLSDYRTSILLKGKRLFHTKFTRLFDGKSLENATTIERLLPYDYYDYWKTIRFMGLLTTVRRDGLRLFYDYWLRLFQPERRDYC